MDIIYSRRPEGEQRGIKRKKCVSDWLAEEGHDYRRSGYNKEGCLSASLTGDSVVCSRYLKSSSMQLHRGR